MEEPYEVYCLLSDSTVKKIVKREIPISLKEKFIERFKDCNVSTNMLETFLEDNLKDQ
jgi:hypothetical protein